MEREYLLRIAREYLLKVDKEYLLREETLSKMIEYGAGNINLHRETGGYYTNSSKSVCDYDHDRNYVILVIAVLNLKGPLIERGNIIQ